MRLPILLLITRLPFLVGCTTFGVEAEDHILATDSNAQGIALFEVADIVTNEGMYIDGGAARFTGEMRITGWFKPGADRSIFDYLSLAFDVDGDVLRPYTLFHSADAEHVTVREVFFEVPRDLDVAVYRPEGGLAVTNIAGSLTVGSSAGSVSATVIDGPVWIEGGGTVHVDRTGPVDIEISGSVDGGVREGGYIDVGEGSIDIAVTSRDFEALYMTTEEGNVEVSLPSGGFVLDIEAGVTTDYDTEDDDEPEPGHVVIRVGNVSVDTHGYVSEVYVVNGGGPLIMVRGAHDLEIR